MRELYLKRIQKESQYNEVEMEAVLKSKEILQVKRKVGDVGEEEYRIKLAAIDWDINNITEKQNHQKKSLRMLCGVSEQISSENLEKVTNISSNIENSIANMDVDQEVKETATQNMKMVSKII
jgi:hypothetical protein